MVFPILCLINWSYLKCTASDCPKGSEERLAGERSEKMSVGERREPLDVVTKQEMYLQTKEGLQVIQETKRKEERPEEYPLVHTAAKEGVLLLLLY